MATAKKAPSKKKKGKVSYKKVLGFDLNDKESVIYFNIFAVIAVLLIALLIAGFVLGFSRCGSEVVSDTDVSAADAAVEEAESPYADIAHVIDVYRSVSGSDAYEYNYSNDAFELAYDPAVVNVFDTFADKGTVTVAKENGKSTGLTVTYNTGMENVDPAEHLDRFVNVMNTYGTVTDIEADSFIDEQSGASVAVRSFSLEMPDYTIRVITRMDVLGDKAIVSQLALGADQSDAEMASLTDSFKSVRFRA